VRLDDSILTLRPRLVALLTLSNPAPRSEDLLLHMAEPSQSLKKRNEEQEDRWAHPVLGDWLFLGCAKDAKNLIKIRQNKISALYFTLLQSTSVLPYTEILQRSFLFSPRHML
jgi:hypothetical protein